jgi:mRNA interferase RelE/StbE
MIVEFDISFLKSLSKNRDQSTLKKLEKVIRELENASSLQSVASTKKLVGFSSYYRIRIGDYRLGFELLNKDTVRLIIITHRKDIYKKFP